MRLNHTHRIDSIMRYTGCRLQLEFVIRANVFQTPEKCVAMSRDAAVSRLARKRRVLHVSSAQSENSRARPLQHYNGETDPRNCNSAKSIAYLHVRIRPGRIALMDRSEALSFQRTRCRCLIELCFHDGEADIAERNHSDHEQEDLAPSHDPRTCGG